LLKSQTSLFVTGALSSKVKINNNPFYAQQTRGTKSSLAATIPMNNKSKNAYVSLNRQSVQMNASAALSIPNDEQPKNILDLLSLENLGMNQNTRLSQIMDDKKAFTKSIKSSLNSNILPGTSQKSAFKFQPTTFLQDRIQGMNIN